MTRLRNALALVAVVAALLALSALYKRETCGCSGPGLPYATIAVGALVVTLIAFAAYFATGLFARRA